MKKFFSLVLALVMALSLTTIAWGADPVVAKVGDTEYTDLQAAIVAAAPAGTVEIVDDVTVAEWKMFAETMTHADIITRNINGLTINGNGKTLTVNSIVSGGNGGYLFYAAEKLNINNLTITYGTGVNGGISLKAGTLDTVTFAGGNGVLPGAGDVTIKNCVFNTTGQAIYYEEARPNLEITDNEFNVADTANVIILRGGETFTENEVNSGRTVNIKNDTTTVSGNTFNTRVKLYEEGQELSGNSFTEDAKIDIEDGVTEVNVSGNYWGGGAPSADQIPAAIADKVTVDTYATAVAADGTTSGLVSAAGVPTTHPSNCNSKDVSLKDCTLVDLTTGDSYDFDKTDKATLYTFNNVTSTVNGVKTTEYGATVYYFDGMYGLVVAKDYANAQLELANGKFVYLRGISAAEFVNSTGRTDIVVDSFIDAADPIDSCGDALDDYAVVDGDFYAAEGTTLAYYKGEFVLIGGTEIAAADAFVPHTFFYAPADCKWNVKDNEIVSVKCTCGDTFKVVQDIKGLASGTYAPLGGGDYVILKATSSGKLPSGTTTPSTDKVQSADTFDAGIAMYVGMSVMAAAGSVVVLKKRED